jgi:hypothetical protein
MASSPIPRMSNPRAAMPFTPNFLLGVARFFDFEFWVEHDLPRTFRICLRR